MKLSILKLHNILSTNIKVTLIYHFMLSNKPFDRRNDVKGLFLAEKTNFVGVRSLHGSKLIGLPRGDDRINVVGHVDCDFQRRPYGGAY